MKNIVDRTFDACVVRLPWPLRIRLQYLKSFRRLPNLNNPTYFSEKIQCMKRGAGLAPYVDKVAAKDIIRDWIGARYVIPTLYSGEWLPPREQRTWPLPFVVKGNHGSGLNIFVRETPDWDFIEKKLRTFMDYDFGSMSGDLNYREVKRRVLVEPFISRDGTLPLDYKFFVFAGRIEFVQVDTRRETEHRRSFFDRDWNPLPIKFLYPPETAPIPRPKAFDEMLTVAERLGSHFSFVRVDLYDIAGAVYFGELSFGPESGLAKWEPRALDQTLGALWQTTADAPSASPRFGTQTMTRPS